VNSIDLQLTPTPTTCRGAQRPFRRGPDLIGLEIQSRTPSCLDENKQRWSWSTILIIHGNSDGFVPHVLRPGALVVPLCNLPRGQVFTRVCSPAAWPNTAKKYSTCKRFLVSVMVLLRLRFIVNEVSPIGYTGSVWLCQKYPKSFLSTKHARSWACNAVLGLVLKYAFYALDS
jgi:hypothetical protein